jgi:hypothetical protein
MAETPEEEDEDEEEWEDDDELEINEDYILRGFRFFYENISGFDHNIEDERIELEENEMLFQDAINRIPYIKPNSNFITQKLLEQGINMDQLVKIFLKDHIEYEEEEDELIRLDDELYGKFRIIISNYQSLPREELIE